MKIVQRAGQCAREEGPVCAAIGVFDGLHLGHQKVIRTAQAEAREHHGQTVIITFDRHPQSVVNPARAPLLLYPLWKKLNLLESLEVTTVLLLPFDEAFSRILASEFIRALARDLSPWVSLSVGSNFHFGFQRSGNLELLHQWGKKLHFRVHGVPALTRDGAAVSSTRIREAVQRGRLAEAQQMLGRPYTLCGPVRRGDQVGRTLGFPTANLDTRELVTPPGGVYAAWAWLAGRKYPAVLNHGFRPTLTQTRPHRQIEAHLLDFSEDIYDREMEIEFVAKLREEIHFPSLEALKRQIAADVQLARSHFAG